MAGEFWGDAFKYMNPERVVKVQFDQEAWKRATTRVFPDTKLLTGTVSWGGWFKSVVDEWEKNVVSGSAYDIVNTVCDGEKWAVLDVHPEDEKLMEGTSFDAYRKAVAQEGEMNRKKFLGQYDNPADEYALKAKSPVDSGPTEPISQWLRPKG